MTIEPPDWTGFWVAFFGGAALMVLILAVAWRRMRSYHRRLVDRASVTPEGLHVTTRSRDKAHVRWEDLENVTLVTTKSGPATTDAWWELKLTSGRVFEITGERSDSTEILEKLQTLKGFNNEAVVQASLSTKKARFVCWKRDTPKAT